jgi:malic enzyme
MNGGQAGSRPPTARSRIEVTPAVAIDDAQAPPRVYTPGVAEDRREIAADPAAASRLTVRGNSVAVVSDGSAVPDSEHDAGHIVPDIFAEGLAPAVARAVRDS